MIAIKKPKSFKLKMTNKPLALIKPFPNNDSRAKIGFSLYDQAIHQENQGNKKEARNLFLESIKSGVPEPYNSYVRKKYGIAQVLARAAYPQIDPNEEVYVEINPTGRQKFCPYCGAEMLLEHDKSKCPDCGAIVEE